MKELVGKQKGEKIDWKAIGARFPQRTHSQDVAFDGS